MEIVLIAAASENNVIGRRGTMPWHLSSDLKYFKNQTWGLPILMGRKTFESFGHSKGLPGRLNLVLTRQKSIKGENMVLVNSIEDALFVAKQKDYKILMVIGGGELYNMIFPKADKILLTRVHTVITDGDTYFPQIDPKKWKLTSSQDFPADDKNDYSYNFEVWERM